MNAARAGRNVAGLAVRRAGASTPSQAVQRQVANKTTASKGKGVVGAPPKAKADSPPKVSQETLNPPPSAPKPPPVAHETVTPPLAPGGPAAAVPPKTKSNNLLIGTVLVGAAAASYYVTIHKMKDQDFLGDAEKEAMEEAQVNLHKSGLKVSNKVVPDKVEKVYSKTSEGLSNVASKAGDKMDKVSAEAKDAAGNVRAKASEAASRVRSEISDAASDVSSEASDAAAGVKAAAKGEEEKPKKKGWRKYIIFGPRREA